jgi:WD40 repeat protein
MLRKMFILFFISLGISSCASDENSLGAMIVSVSSDGNYAISNAGKRIILWDIKNKQKKLISDNGNIYSPYFIKHTSYFMWQDLNNIVHIQNVNGKEILNFANFPVYGQVMTSDLKHYFASDVNWTIFSGFGNNQRQMKKFCSRETNSFYGYQKLFNLILSNNSKYLVSSGSDSDSEPISAGMCNEETTDENGFTAPVSSLFNGTTMWDISTEKPLFKIYKLEGKSISAISPDEKYIVAGDENANLFVFDIITGKKLYDVDRVFIDENESNIECASHMTNITCGSIKNGIMKEPNGNDGNGILVFSLKFLDLKGDYFRFTAYMRYGILLNVKNKLPLKYFYLGDSPDVTTMTFYDHNEAIDSAPEANILVIAKRYTTGIIVYKYDPQKQTLAKIWSPDFYSWWGEIRELQKDNSAYTNQKLNSNDPDFIESLMTTKYKKKN